jgi:hypothetical protein
MRDVTSMTHCELLPLPVARLAAAQAAMETKERDR